MTDRALEPIAALAREDVDGEAVPLFWRLQQQLDLARGETEILNDYYEGDQALVQLGLAIPPELQRFSVILNWPRVTVDGVEQRLDVTGFRLGEGSADDYLWDLWQYNDLDELQSQAHTDALAIGRSFLCIGANAEDADYPIVTIESALEMTAIRDPRSREVVAALRLYGELTDAEPTQQTADMNGTRATLYLPDSTHWLIRTDGGWVDEHDPDMHRLGIVPVVPMLNRHRVTRRRNARVEGVSEMMDVIPIAESASRAVTNGQLAQETHAVPHRVLLGATKADFIKPDGTMSGAFEAYMSGLTALANPNGKAVQFDATDLSNFETMVNLYARVASGLTGMPIEYYGLNTQNAPSAEGQRAGETRLIKKAERKQTSFGHAWEQMARIALRYTGRADGLQLRSLEAIWQDAGTPTRGQITDSVTKLYAAGLVDWETAQEDLGRTPQQIEIMRARREADLALDTGTAVQLAIAASQGGEQTETPAIEAGHVAGELAAGTGEGEPSAA